MNFNINCNSLVSDLHGCFLSVFFGELFFLTGLVTNVCGNCNNKCNKQVRVLQCIASINLPLYHSSVHWVALLWSLPDYLLAVVAVLSSYIVSCLKVNPIFHILSFVYEGFHNSPSTPQHNLHFLIVKIVRVADENVRKGSPAKENKRIM